MRAEQLTRAIQDGHFDGIFTELYGEEQIERQRSRYLTCIEEFGRIYEKDRDLRLFSVSGRSEISGNHTDHNNGKVLAASIDLDIIAVAARNDSNFVYVKSSGFQMDAVNLNDLNKRKYHKSALMIAGVCEGFRRFGYQAGGFDAYTTSNVFKASGLSSSAAFEDMIGTIQNYLYNEGQVDKVEIAKIAQYAEREFYGKPCGLMDQVACIYGGFVAIDFENPANPIVEPLSFAIEDAGYRLCIVNTGGNHSDLTDDYADIPREMRAVAGYFGKKSLREVTLAQVVQAAGALRTRTGDRAILRAMHYLQENERVEAQKQALKEGDVATFLKKVNESGRSSFQYLQNIYTNKNVHEQGLSLALVLAETALAGKEGACRVHGGGFAGTIQAFVKEEDVPAFSQVMEDCFGEGACVCLKIRPYGGLCVDEKMA
ncbi:MAG: galactokinase [Clostridiales bacterium]|nr:galactokinase [Clostridiales bacterium]